MNWNARLKIASFLQISSLAQQKIQSFLHLNMYHVKVNKLNLAQSFINGYTHVYQSALSIVMSLTLVYL